LQRQAINQRRMEIWKKRKRREEVKQENNGLLPFV
jgi:hypothetical protein